jgi:hypothetical protein
VTLGEDERVPSWPEVCSITCEQAQFAAEAWPEVPGSPPLGELNPSPRLHCGQALAARALAFAAATWDDPDATCDDGVVTWDGRGTGAGRLSCDQARRAYRVLLGEPAFWDDPGYGWDGRRTALDADRDCGSIPLPRPVPS